MFSLEIEVAEVSGKNIHILSDFVGGNSRVDLCGLDICVSEHLWYRLDGHSTAEGHGSGEGMSGQMEGQVLLDAADVGYLLQIAI